jgi:hypothetical protein
MDTHLIASYLLQDAHLKTVYKYPAFQIRVAWNFPYKTIISHIYVRFPDLRLLIPLGILRLTVIRRSLRRCPSQQYCVTPSGPMTAPENNILERRSLRYINCNRRYRIKLIRTLIKQIQVLPSLE